MMKSVSVRVLQAALFSFLILTAIPALAQEEGEKPVGKFSGQWMTAFSKDGIPARGSGTVKITVHPDDGFFTCKLSGSVVGSGEFRGGEMKVKASMSSSGCKGSYSPDTGYIDGSFTANENTTATLTMPEKKPKTKSKSSSWRGKFRGKIADAAGEGFWADDEGHDASWTVSGSFTGAEEVAEKEDGEEDPFDEDEWDTFDNYDPLEEAREVTDFMLFAYKDYQNGGGKKQFSEFLKNEIKDPEQFEKVEAMVMLTYADMKEQDERKQKAKAEMEDNKKTVKDVVKSYELYRKGGGKVELMDYADVYVKDPKKKAVVKKIINDEIEYERALNSPFIWVTFLSEEYQKGSSSEEIVKASERVNKDPTEKAKLIYETTVEKEWEWTKDGKKVRKGKNYRNLKKIKKKNDKAMKKNFKKDSKTDKGKQLRGWSALGKGLGDVAGGDTDSKGSKAFEEGLKYNCNKTFVKKVKGCSDGEDKKACRSVDKF